MLKNKKTMMVGVLLMINSCAALPNVDNKNLKFESTNASIVSAERPFQVESVGTPNGFVKPIPTYPNRGTYLDYLGYNSYFPGKVHVGIDFPSPVGTAVLSIATGKIVAKDVAMPGFGGEGLPGGAIIIKYKTKDNLTFYVLYGHLKNLTAKKVGDVVVMGEQLGEVGNYIVKRVQNGKMVTLNWAHLHFGINVKVLSYAGYSAKPSQDGWIQPITFLVQKDPNPIIEANKNSKSKILELLK